MSEYARINLKKGKEDMVARRHPWIFSGAVAQAENNLLDGDIVEVYAHDNTYLCTGHYQDASIKVRIITYEQGHIGEEFWLNKISQAFSLRSMLGLPSDDTNAYRLIHGEGDGLPGLIVDIYGKVAVIQCHSIGMHRAIRHISDAITSVTDIQIIYDKSGAALPDNYAQNFSDSFISGSVTEPVFEIIENNHLFQVDVVTGQKTGFFLDQRENRALLGKYALGKSVLNAFSYTGGFSVYALKAGAKKVVSVDVSARAIAAANDNVSLNSNEDRHEGVVKDVIPYLRESEQFDIVILDPPAFAKTLDKRHNAVQGYKRLNIEGMKKVKSGGLLFTFSCSQVIDRQLFYNTMMSSAIESGRDVKVLHQLGQPADHPVSLFHPEGNYLKGLVLQIL